MNCVQKNS